MNIKIDKKHIAIPEPIRHGRGSVYPWKDLKPGRSFPFPKGVSSKLASSAASLAAKRLGIKLTVRTQEDGTVRCWRLPDERAPRKPRRAKKAAPKRNRKVRAKKAAPTPVTE